MIYMEEYLGFYVKPSKPFYLKTNILQKNKKKVWRIKYPPNRRVCGGYLLVSGK